MTNTNRLCLGVTNDAVCQTVLYQVFITKRFYDYWQCTYYKPHSSTQVRWPQLIGRVSTSAEPFNQSFNILKLTVSRSLLVTLYPSLAISADGVLLGCSNPILTALLETFTCPYIGIIVSLAWIKGSRMPSPSRVLDCILTLLPSSCLPYPLTRLQVASQRATPLAAC